MRRRCRPEVHRRARARHGSGRSCVLPGVLLRGGTRAPRSPRCKVIDTYWSDHCRHTTFSTHLDEVEIDDADGQGRLSSGICPPGWRSTSAEKRRQAAADPHGYRHHRRQDGSRSRACSPSLDESEEINACSIEVPVDVNGEGRRTGCSCSRTRRTTTPPRSSPSAARPPASAGASATPSRAGSYVYQAMRVTGCRRPPTAGVAKRLKASCPSGRSRPPRPPATAPTATRSAWPPARSTELYHAGLCGQAHGGAARSWAPPRPTNVRRETARPPATWIDPAGRSHRP